MKDVVDSIQKGKPNVGAVDYVKELSTITTKSFQSLCIIKN